MTHTVPRLADYWMDASEHPAAKSARCPSTSTSCLTNSASTSSSLPAPAGIPASATRRRSRQSPVGMRGSSMSSSACAARSAGARSALRGRSRCRSPEGIGATDYGSRDFAFTSHHSASSAASLARSKLPALSSSFAAWTQWSRLRLYIMCSLRRSVGKGSGMADYNGGSEHG
jgi:hypothetical protein